MKAIRYLIIKLTRRTLITIEAVYPSFEYKNTATDSFMPNPDAVIGTNENNVVIELIKKIMSIGMLVPKALKIIDNVIALKIHCVMVIKKLRNKFFFLVLM